MKTLLGHYAKWAFTDDKLVSTPEIWAPVQTPF